MALDGNESEKRGNVEGQGRTERMRGCVDERIDRTKMLNNSATHQDVGLETREDLLEVISQPGLFIP